MTPGATSSPHAHVALLPASLQQRALGFPFVRRDLYVRAPVTKLEQRGRELFSAVSGPALSHRGAIDLGLRAQT